MMLSRRAIERPVFSTVISLLLVVMGLGALERLPVRAYPDVDPPIVSVVTVYPGAPAEVVERDIAEPIEEVTGSIEGIRQIISTSREQVSSIDIEFQLSRDLDAAAADVRDKLSQVRADLPEDAEDPTIAKTSGQSDPIMWLTLQSDERSRLELTDYTNRQLVDAFAVVPGVARVVIGGGREYAMRIWLNREAMAARGIIAGDVASALRPENLELPAGRIESDVRELTVRSMTRLHTAEEFRALVLNVGGDGGQVTLGDIARVEVGAADERSAVHVDGAPALGLGIIRQSKANTLDVAQSVREEAERRRHALPSGVRLEVSYDKSEFITDSITEVVKALGVAAVLVVLVLLVFLRSPRTALIPAVTIPVSLLAAVAVLYLLGYSGNRLTLLAAVLAIGLVVDDAIVVLENVYRRTELGEARLLAGARGADQIGFAVIATSLVLISVFLPLTVLTGDVGRLFTEFAVALAAAVAFSSLVALTLGATLSVRLIQAHKADSEPGWLAQRFGIVAGKAAAGYRRALDAALTHTTWTLVGAALLGLAAAAIYRSLPQEQAPTEDQSLIVIPVEAPQGASFDYTSRHVRKIEAMLSPMAGDDGPVERVISILAPGRGGAPASPGEALLLVKLKPRDLRTASQMEIVDRLLPQLLGLPGVQAFAVNPPSLGQRGFSRPVQMVISGPTHATANRWAEDLLAKARELPVLVDPRLDYQRTKPQVQVRIDREKAAELGIDARDLAESLQLMLGDQEVTDYVYRGQSYEVILRAAVDDRATPSDLGRIRVRGKDGELLQLKGLIDIETVGAPNRLRRIDRLPSVTLSASTAPGVALGDAIEALQAAAGETLPNTARISWLDRSEAYLDSRTAIYVTFALALLVAYLVLAAQFESFLHPLVILVSVPLAITGGLLGLLVTGQTMNIFAQIGLIMLIGLNAKNGILIVEFANQLRDQGRDVTEAAREAALTRLRPVAMTSIATVFGALPLALASGAGAEGRIPIGVTVIGGMIVATLMVLVVVPVLYTLLARHTRPTGAVATKLAQLERDSGNGKPREDTVARRESSRNRSSQVLRRS
jgi:multidrug efflux pump